MRKGFTIVELLVVVAIITILGIVALILLNPAELLSQGRDSSRVSDMSTLNNAMNAVINDLGITAGLYIGSSSVTYVSIPDPTATTTSGTDCAGIGFLAGGYFHCAASSTFTKIDGTGWIPVNFTKMTTGSPISHLPVDPVNTTSSNEYYTYNTDGNSFKIRSLPESKKYINQTGPNSYFFTTGSNMNLGGGNGWILVPGNTTFGTNNFYVMKYLASCSDGQGAAYNDHDGGYQTYDDTLLNCTPANGRSAASIPGGWPIGNLSQTSAINYCANIGAHLVNNNEWQTMAWSAENTGSNWSSGTVGSGHMYSGHSDNVPATAATSDPNDGNGYAGTDGPVAGGGTGTGGVNAQTQKRTFTLANGSVIWDLAGNTWEWTNDTIINKNEPGIGGGGFAWNEFTAVTTWGTMSQQTVSGANASWNSTQGIGELFSDGTPGVNWAYGFVRGGYWNTGYVNAGVEALNQTFASSTVNFFFGFRCAR